MDLLLDPIPDLLFSHLEVMAGLKVEPALRRCTEVLNETQEVVLGDWVLDTDTYDMEVGLAASFMC